MSSHESALLQAILASPDDVALRLVYADWLQEQGDPRGELMALQCRTDELSEEQEEAATERERALLEAHEAQWLAELGLVPGEAVLDRGLVERIQTTQARLGELLPVLGTRTPLRAVEVSEVEDLLALLELLGSLPHLDSLDLDRNGLHADHAAILAAPRA